MKRIQPGEGASVYQPPQAPQNASVTDDPTPQEEPMHVNLDQFNNPGGFPSGILSIDPVLERRVADLERRVRALESKSEG